MFTDAGISCTGRPSRLALVATRLPLSGVGTTTEAPPGGVGTASVTAAGCVVGTGLGAVRAARLARFGKRLRLVAGPRRIAARVRGRDHHRIERAAGFAPLQVLAYRQRPERSGKAALESQRRGEEIRWKQRARTRDDGRVVEIFEIDTGVTNGEQ